MLGRSLANPGGITRQGKQEVKMLWGPFQSKRRSNREAKTDALLKIKSRLHNSQREAKKWKYCTVPGNWEHPVLINSYNTCVYNNIIAAFWNDAKKLHLLFEVKFEMVQKRRLGCWIRCNESPEFKNVYIYNLLPWVTWGLTRPATQAQGQATTHLNELSTNTARDAKTKPWRD